MLRFSKHSEPFFSNLLKTVYLRNPRQNSKEISHP